MLAKIFFRILFIIFLVVLAVLAYDFLPELLNWLGRIKIGRVTENKEWLDKVRAVTLSWASKGAPTVPKNENQRLKLVNEIKNRKAVSPICYWQDAAVLKALTDKTGIETKESIEDFLDRYIDENSGDWRKKPEKVDAAILAYEMLSNKYIDNNFIEPAMITVAQMLKDNYDKNGYIPYNAGLSKVCFVDTIGMVCPFLIKYAVVYQKAEFVNIAVRQIGQYFKLGFDEKTKLPYHCFDTETQARLGICGWGRGCGWWAVGITDSLKEIMNLDGFNKEKALLLKLSVSFFDNFEKYICENGAVNRMVLNNSLQDSSASAMIAYCYAYMFTLTNKKIYFDNAERILRYLKSATRRNGVIDYSQGDTMGIGYYSPNLSVVPAAQGFAVAAADIIYK